MSLNKTQIDALIDRNCKTANNPNAYPVAEKTADINLAIDKYLAIAIKAGGSWQLDDSSHPDYPIIFTNIQTGQRDYSFTVDGSGNLILDIYKVQLVDVNGNATDIYPIDQQAQGQNWGNNFQPTSTGAPYRYDKTGNGIFLDPIPNYDRTAGLKVFINREAMYFTVADTTRKPGFTGLFHEYFALRPSYQYAYRNSMANAKNLQDELLRMEKEIQENYTSRERDVKKSLKINHESNR